MLAKMWTFLSITKCRRRTLLEHFDPKAQLLNDKDVYELCCDNCTEK